MVDESNTGDGIPPIEPPATSESSPNTGGWQSLRHEGTPPTPEGIPPIDIRAMLGPKSLRLFDLLRSDKSDSKGGSEGGSEQTQQAVEDFFGKLSEDQKKTAAKDLDVVGEWADQLAEPGELKKSLSEILEDKNNEPDQKAASETPPTETS